MNNLSQECIDTINGFVYFPTTEPTATEILRDGMKKALTEPLLYQSAGLMTVDEALRFAEWVVNESGQNVTMSTELLNIFRNQNQKS